MTGYVLIEDERFACEEMNRMMRKLRPEYSCLGSAGSVEEAVALLKRTRPDLMLVDVSLADGICFEIFDQVPEDIPVIFTTAYDEYAIKAFKVNSVDYLLKPVDEGDLEAAVGFHLQEQEEPLSRPDRGLVPAYRHQGHSLFLQ